jgi:hypothetical protein
MTVNIKGTGKMLRANAERRVVLVGRRSVASMKARSQDREQHASSEQATKTAP